MATLSQLTDDVYNMLYGIAQQERPIEDTQVTATFTAVATEIEMSTPAAWRKDDYAEAASDGDIIIFAEHHPAATNTATVRRSQRGSTATEHLTASTVWYKNPKFTRVQIERFINEVVRTDLWHPDKGVWTVHHGTVTYSEGDSTYDLPQYIEDITMMYQYNLGSDGGLHPLPRSMWAVERQINTAVSANSNLLRLRQPFDTGETIYYTGKRRPHVDDLANMSDEVAQLIPWAVVGKMMAGVRGAAKRHDPPRADRDTTEGGEFRDYRGFMSEFLRQKNQLNKQLLSEVREEKVFIPKQRRRRW